MSQELLPAETKPPFMQQRTGMTAINAGAVSIEQERAIAEARGSIQIAQMFPRDMASARAELMSECEYLEFASVAFYSVPRSGGAVSGPSIRLAESVASAYGHMEWGHRELSRSEDKSEVEVFAWDKQKNNRRTRQITVDHYRDTKSGRHRLRDEKDIQDKISNVAAKQMRGCILAILPKSLTEAAMARCRATISSGGGMPLVERINRMVDAFAKIGVTIDLLTEYLGHPLSQTNGDEIVDLTGIYQAIKSGDRIADFFGNKDEQEEGGEDLGASLAKTANANAAKSDQQQSVAAKPPRARAAKPAAKDEVKKADEARPEVVATSSAEKPETAAQVEPDAKADPEADEQATNTSNQVEEESTATDENSTQDEALQAQSGNDASGDDVEYF